MNFKAWVLLVAVLWLSACSTTLTTTVQEKTDKPSPPSISVERMDAQFLYLASQQALGQGQVALAMRFLGALLKKDPLATQPRLELVDLYLASGQKEFFQRASSLLDSMPEESVSSLKGDAKRDYQLLSARLLIVNGHEEQAKPLLQRLSQQNPEHKQIRLLLVGVCVNQGDFKQAHLLLAQAIAIQRTPYLLKMQIQLYLQQGDMLRAEESLLSMQKAFPADEGVALQRSQLAASAGHTAKAEQILLVFIEQYGAKAQQASVMLAELYVQDGAFAEATEVLVSLLPLATTPFDVYLALGKVYYQTEDYAKSADMFGKAIILQDRETAGLGTVYYYMAASLEASNQWEESVQYYERLQKEDSLYLDAQLRLANIELSHHKDAQAESRLEILRDSFQSEIRVYEMLSSLRLQQKAYEKLLVESEKVLTLLFSEVLLFNRAIALEALKQFGRFDATLSLLLENKPGHAEALNFYGYSLADRGIRLQEALGMIDGALQAKPDDGYYLDTKAWVLFKQGKYAQAIVVQIRALALVPKDPLMQEHMGDMYWQVDQHEKARGHWKKALRLGDDTEGRVQKKIERGLM